MSFPRDDRIDLLVKAMNADWDWIIDENEAEMILESVDKINDQLSGGSK